MSRADDQRRDYGPQGCAEDFARAVGVFALLLALLVKVRKGRRR